MRVSSAVHPGTAVPGSPVGDFFVASGVFFNHRGHRGRDGWSVVLFCVSFLAAPLYGKDAIAPHPRRLSPVPGRGENLVASYQFLVFSYGAFLRVFASSRETNRS